MSNLFSGGSITVFFPAFNDEGSIAPLVTSALAVLSTLTNDYEVIVVDDGSTDRTPAIADQIARSLSRVKVIHHPTNQGYGAALRTGFGQASKDFIFYTDGDGQYNVSELVGLCSLMSEDVDVVNGYKRKRQDSHSRRALGAIYNRLARFFFRLPIRDIDCDFRLLRRSAIERISLGASSGVICVEMIRKLSSAGCVFREIPVGHYPRLHGKSQFFTPSRVVRTVFDLLVLWWKLVICRAPISNVIESPSTIPESAFRA